MGDQTWSVEVGGSGPHQVRGTGIQRAYNLAESQKGVTNVLLSLACRFSCGLPGSFCGNSCPDLVRTGTREFGAAETLR